MRHRCRGPLGRLTRDEDGSATIEAVLWLPVFFWLIMIVADASLAFLAKAEAFRILQDGNRLYSVHALKTTAEVEAYVKQRLGSLSSRAVATSATAKVNTTFDVVQTTLEIPITDVVLFNTLSVMDSWSMSIRAEHYVEQRP